MSAQPRSLTIEWRSIESGECWGAAVPSFSGGPGATFREHHFHGRSLFQQAPTTSARLGAREAKGRPTTAPPSASASAKCRRRDRPSQSPVGKPCDKARLGHGEKQRGASHQIASVTSGEVRVWDGGGINAGNASGATIPLPSRPHSIPDGGIQEASQERPARPGRDSSAALNSEGK